MHGIEGNVIIIIFILNDTYTHTRPNICNYNALMPDGSCSKNIACKIQLNDPVKTKLVFFLINRYRDTLLNMYIKSFYFHFTLMFQIIE